MRTRVQAELVEPAELTRRDRDGVAAALRPWQEKSRSHPGEPDLRVFERGYDSGVPRLAGPLRAGGGGPPGSSARWMRRRQFGER